MFKAGNVIKLYVEDTNPPKPKFLVIVGSTGGEIATVFINSRKESASIPKGIQASILPISPNELPGLDHNSFIDCSEIVARDKNEINRILQKEPFRKIGCLSKEKTDEVLRLVNNSRNISTADKKKFGLF